MITMLHYDALQDPTPADCLTLTQHASYLEKHPYERFADEEIENVILKFNSIVSKLILFVVI